MKFIVKTVGKDVRVVLFRRGQIIYYRFWWKGKRYRESTEKSIEREAREVARQEVERVAEVSIPVVSRTLKQCVDESIETRWPSKEGRSYRDALNRLAAFQEFAKPDTIITAKSFDAVVSLVQRFCDKRRADKVSAQTIHNERTILSTFFTWMIKRKWVGWANNPAAKNFLDVQKIEKTIATPLTVDELDAALEKARPTQAYPAIILCLGAGLRPVGPTRIKWTDIDFTERRLIIVEKKKPRVIPISQWVVFELQRWRCGRIFSDDDFVISTQSVLYKWLKLIRKPGERFQLQAARRAFLFKLFSLGVKPQLAAKLAGNSVQTIEKHYLDLQTLDAKNVVDLLDFSATPAQKPTQGNG